MTPPRRGAALTSACALMLSLTLAPPAFGHAAFLESTPAAGERVETAPEEVAVEFTEPVIKRFSSASIAPEDGGAPEVETSLRVAGDRTLVLQPGEPLEPGSYRVDWHTVSPTDGHALDGSFSFGYRAPARGGVHTVEEGPFARGGWLLRVGLRALFYASLLFFAGGLLVSALLDRGRPATWLAAAPEWRADGAEADVRERAWRRTSDIGWVAAAAGVAVAIAEAADASGGVTLDGVRGFLASGTAGTGRVVAVIAIAGAAALAPRVPKAAALLVSGGFLGIAVSGHAASAEPRLVAVATDWIHLLAAAVWVGGIAQIAVAWLPRARRDRGGLGRAVMRTVLGRFGQVALPAFLLVAATGLTNALIELDRPSALVETSYGLVLAAKVALVALIAAASYWHALRLRPRVLAANPHPPPPRAERRHWRLLGAEPVLGVLVAAAAALLVAFPLPPRQAALAEGAHEAAAPGPGPVPCDPCPQRRPRPRELAVAEHAGSTLVAAWVRQTPAGLAGEARLYGLNFAPIRAPATVRGATSQESCGPGCVEFLLAGRPTIAAISLREDGARYTARLPVRWHPGGAARARRLLRRAQRVMRRLASVRQYERITSGPAGSVTTRYRLSAPDRVAYKVVGGGRTVVIGGREWSRPRGQPSWTRRPYGAGLPFSTRRWFRWTTYARAVRLLSVERGSAVIALADHQTPLWYRLRIDLGTYRVTDARMIADGHFMTQRFSRFDERLQIEPPPPEDVG